jgi:hypothetical protein
MRKLFVWLAMLTKRQFKRPAFVCLLILIPVLVFGYTALTQGQSGAVTVALAYQSEDALAQMLCDKLENESMLIRFIFCDTMQAEDLVKTGKADAAWIFPEDTQAALKNFVQGNYKPFIRVVERESSTSMLLSREKLAAAVFTAGSEMFYESYLRENVQDLADVPVEMLMEHYHGIMMDGALFQFEDITGAAEQLADQKSYLLSPLRGILGVLAAVCAMAVSMHYCHDLEKGVFSWVREDRRPILELLSQLISLFSLLAISALCLAATGLTENLWRELLLLFVYGFSCAGFGMLLRVLLKNRKGIATALPMISVVMLAVCPVFFNLEVLRYWAMLLPATYYINGTTNAAYLFGGAVYGTACLFLYFLIGAIKKGVS